MVGRTRKKTISPNTSSELIFRTSARTTRGNRIYGTNRRRKPYIAGREKPCCLGIGFIVWTKKAGTAQKKNGLATGAPGLPIKIMKKCDEILRKN